MSTDSKVMVPLVDKVAYGAGNLATGVAMQILGSFFVFYATAILGLPGKFVGIVMGLSIFWDAVTDPVMGHISDRTRSRRLGRRHPYLLGGALGIALVNYMIWTIDPALVSFAKIALATVLVLLFKTFMTVYVTPYTALGAELSTEYNERTTIQSIKAVFFVMGLNLVSVGGMFWFFRPTALYPVGQLNPDAYSFMGLASSLVVLGSALAAFFPTLKYIEPMRRPSGESGGMELSSLRVALADAWKNRPLRMVVYTYTFSNLSSALLGNLGLIVFTYTFGFSNRDIALVVGVQFLCAMLSQPLWDALSRKMGKMPALVLGFGLSTVGSVYFSVMVFLHASIQGSALALIPFALTAGSGIGALFTLPLSMVADTVDLNESEGGARLEGLYYGTMTLSYKLAQAVALVVIGVLIDAFGFDASAPTQERLTIVALGLVLGLGATVSFVAAILAIIRYPLTEAKVHECRARIAESKAAAGLPSS
jgi:Na+/melibiose symporter-like transporter